MPNSAALIFFLIFSNSCRRPLDFGDVGRLENPQEILARVRAGDEALKALQADARMQLSSPSGSGSASVFVSAAKPGLLYLEVQDFFGRPQATLVSNGERFGSYQAQEGVFYQGPASPANVSRLLPLELSAEELVGLFLGQVRTLPGEPVRLEVDERMGAYRMEIQAQGQSQTLWIHPKLFRIHRSEMSNGYSVQLDDFLAGADTVFPQKVELEALQGKTTVKLTYKKSALKVNVVEDPSTFDVTAPEGTPVVELDEWGERLRVGP